MLNKLLLHNGNIGVFDQTSIYKIEVCHNFYGKPPYLLYLTF